MPLYAYIYLAIAFLAYIPMQIAAYRMKLPKTTPIRKIINPMIIAACWPVFLCDLLVEMAARCVERLK